MGHLSPRHGFSCDWILSANIVLADGRVITVSPTSHPDLYWALRGAGDNFGVVVSLETQLHAIPDRAQLGTWAWGADEAAEIMRKHRDMDRTISDGLFWLAELTVSDEAGGTLRYVITAVHVGPDDVATRELGAIDGFGGTPLERSIKALDWVDLHYAFDDAWPNTRQYWAGAEIVELDDATLDLLREEGQRIADDPARAPLVSIIYSRYHGAMLRHVTSPPPAMNRRYGSELTVVSFYDDQSRDEYQEEWAEGVISRFRDAGLLFVGAVPNYTTHVEPREAWGEDYDRLAELKAEYDSDNVFHMNPNIEPKSH